MRTVNISKNREERREEKKEALLLELIVREVEGREVAKIHESNVVVVE